MDEKDKNNDQPPICDVPEDVRNDPSQIHAPTQIILEREPIPNPDLEKKK